ncbi:unnamed protein product [Pedinophyceae sp. YPF-701]|nr:unnamed protein product [Pedinophyceae sp. YPF-701]
MPGVHPALADPGPACHSGIRTEEQGRHRARPSHAQGAAGGVGHAAVERHGRDARHHRGGGAGGAAQAAGGPRREGGDGAAGSGRRLQLHGRARRVRPQGVLQGGGADDSLSLTSAIAMQQALDFAFPTDIQNGSAEDVVKVLVELLGELYDLDIDSIRPRYGDVALLLIVMENKDEDEDGAAKSFLELLVDSCSSAGVQGATPPGTLASQLGLLQKHWVEIRLRDVLATTGNIFLRRPPPSTGQQPVQAVLEELSNSAGAKERADLTVRLVHAMRDVYDSRCGRRHRSAPNLPLREFCLVLAFTAWRAATVLDKAAKDALEGAEEVSDDTLRRFRHVGAPEWLRRFFQEMYSGAKPPGLRGRGALQRQQMELHSADRAHPRPAWLLGARSNAPDSTRALPAPEQQPLLAPGEVAGGTVDAIVPLTAYCHHKEGSPLDPAGTASVCVVNDPALVLPAILDETWARADVDADGHFKRTIECLVPHPKHGGVTVRATLDVATFGQPVGGQPVGGQPVGGRWRASVRDARALLHACGVSPGDRLALKLEGATQRAADTNAPRPQFKCVTGDEDLAKALGAAQRRGVLLKLPVPPGGTDVFVRRDELRDDAGEVPPLIIDGRTSTESDGSQRVRWSLRDSAATVRLAFKAATPEGLARPHAVWARCTCPVCCPYQDARALLELRLGREVRPRIHIPGLRRCLEGLQLPAVGGDASDVLSLMQSLSPVALVLDGGPDTERGDDVPEDAALFDLVINGCKKCGRRLEELEAKLDDKVSANLRETTYAKENEELRKCDWLGAPLEKLQAGAPGWRGVGAVVRKHQFKGGVQRYLRPASALPTPALGDPGIPDWSHFRRDGVPRCMLFSPMQAGGGEVDLVGNRSRFGSMVLAEVPDKNLRVTGEEVFVLRGQLECTGLLDPVEELWGSKTALPTKLEKAIKASGSLALTGGDPGLTSALGELKVVLVGAGAVTGGMQGGARAGIHDVRCHVVRKASRGRDPGEALDHRVGIELRGLCPGVRDRVGLGQKADSVAGGMCAVRRLTDNEVRVLRAAMNPEQLLDLDRVEDGDGRKPDADKVLGPFFLVSDDPLCAAAAWFERGQPGGPTLPKCVDGAYTAFKEEQALPAPATGGGSPHQPSPPTAGPAPGTAAAHPPPAPPASSGQASPTATESSPRDGAPPRTAAATPPTAPQQPPPTGRQQRAALRAAQEARPPAAVSPTPSPRLLSYASAVTEDREAFEWAAYKRLADFYKLLGIGP